MTSQLKVYLDDTEDFEALRTWMTGQHSDVTVVAVQRLSEPHAQGSGWDFLSVLCGTGGAATVALQALKVWIESRVTSVQVVVGEDEFTVTGRNAELVLPKVTEALRALEAARRDASP